MGACIRPSSIAIRVIPAAADSYEQQPKTVSFENQSLLCERQPKTVSFVKKVIFTTILWKNYQFI